MIIPVRCFSCGKVIASTYVKFNQQVDEIKSTGRDPTPAELSSILDNLGVERYCCRRMVLSHTDLIDEILPFS
ncbi:MAG TPA: DNA-directed RNA polymerase subunit N [Thermoplasmataceae archaeon]|nr:DNA-directed RNA polymerase subunit N [Thermoplasmatales archaeon AK]HLH86266.1 DNA-directed RNA polymerase subunit N [Thermoplasmataceae archaeon]